MRYEKVAKEDLADGVARQLRTAILTGAHKAGELLPPERDLAAQFGVDRHTLRSALTELEQQKLVHRRQGSGCRVLDFRETGTLDLIKYLVVKPGTDELDAAMIAPVIEIGRVTYLGLIDLVVERADAADLAAMRNALGLFRNEVSGGDERAIVAAERRFFREVFRATHSLFAELLVNTYTQIFDAAIDPEGRASVQWDDAVVSSGRLDAYGSVVDAIERRDAAEARQLVEVIMAGIPAAVATPSAVPAGRRRPRRRTGTG